MDLEKNQCTRIEWCDIWDICEENELSDDVYEELISDYECGCDILCRDEDWEFSLQYSIPEWYKSV